ncbi:MAG: CotH kinase family protein [Oscillospiraceae bacterium]|nr:CotH kinase family protein [Oscillospiraceae bacterium]
MQKFKKSKIKTILAVLTLFSLMMSIFVGDVSELFEPAFMQAEVAAADNGDGTDFDYEDDSPGRFRIRFRDGADFATASNVPAGFRTAGFDVNLFATVGGVVDPTATIHFTTAHSPNTTATSSTGAAAAANPTTQAFHGRNVFTRSVGHATMGHDGLRRFDGGIRPYYWDSSSGERRVTGIPNGIPTLPGGGGVIPVVLDHARGAFTISAVASRVVGGQTVYSEVITRTWVRPPSGAAATSWEDNDFLVVSLYTDARGIFDFDEGFFNCGVDFYEFMQVANAMSSGPSHSFALGRRNSHTNQGDFPPTLPGNSTRRGRGTDGDNTGAERMAHLEIFDPSKEPDEVQIVNQRVGIRVKGGWSRGTFVNEQKTLEIYCRNSYGDRDNVRWPIFGEEHTSDGNLMHRYRRFRVRMGGNDREQTYVRDELANALARVATSDITPVHRPGVVFMNGAYYGLVWVRSPRTEDHWRRFYHGAAQDRLKFLGGSEMGRDGCYRAGCNRALPTGHHLQNTTWTGYNSVVRCSAPAGTADACGRPDCIDFQSSPDDGCDWGACRAVTGPGSWAELGYIAFGARNPITSTGILSSAIRADQLSWNSGSLLVNESNWTRFQELICIENLLQFYALNIFGANVDWPSNNCEMWRYFPTDEERNDPNFHPQLRDGRWRFKIHDMEFAYGLWDGGDPIPSATSHLANTIDALVNRTGLTRAPGGAGGSSRHFNATVSGSWIMPAVLQREDMRVRLANTLLDLIEGSHSTAFARSVYDNLRSQIRTEHSFVLQNSFISSTARNGTNTAGPGWPSSLGDVENPASSQSVTTFLNGRGNSIRGHITTPWREGTTAAPTGLGMTGTGTATTLTVGEGGSAVFNSREIGVISPRYEGDPRMVSSLTMNYYSGANIPVTANPWPGYELDQFTVNGTPVPAAQIQYNFGRRFINIQAGDTVTVSFRRRFSPTNFGQQTVHHPHETVEVVRLQARGQNWLTLANNTDYVISTRGLYLSDNYDGERVDGGVREHDFRWRLPATIIPPNSEIHIPFGSNDDDDHLKNNRIGTFSFSFGERLRLANHDGTIIQHVEVTIMERNQIQQRNSDGVWTLVDGPCRDCDRCGCIQCFPASGGRCERNTCARCWCDDCDRLTEVCICGPRIGFPIVEGDISAVIVDTAGNITVTALDPPSHGERFHFTVRIRLPGEFTMAGFSAPPGVTWSVSGDELTIVGTGNVAWGAGLGSMWGTRDGW